MKSKRYSSRATAGIEAALGFSWLAVSGAYLVLRVSPPSPDAFWYVLFLVGNLMIYSLLLWRSTGRPYPMEALRRHPSNLWVGCIVISLRWIVLILPWEHRMRLLGFIWVGAGGLLALWALTREGPAFTSG